MADKEIIIDGVNVVGCMNYSFKEFINYTECPDYCGEYLDNRCDNHPHCYYKRLKRLEQENAELKAELQNFKDMAKKGLDEFKDVGGCWGCGLQLQLNQDMEDIKQLKADNERLKEELATYRATGVCEVCSDKANKLADKYLGCLQEIKEVAERILEKGLEPQSVEHQLRLRGKRELASIIINLITKAESEG